MRKVILSIVSVNVDFEFSVLKLLAFRHFSWGSNSLTRSETLRQAGEDRLRSSRFTIWTGLNSCTRSDTLLQAGDFIKLCSEPSKKVPDPIKPLKHVSLSVA